MRVTIAGAGNVGQAIARDLLVKGYDVCLIEQDPDVREVAQDLDDAEWVIADGCEVGELEKARPAQTDVMVAATGDDEDNLVISLLSKQEFAVPRVVARVNHPRNAWLFDEHWGVDVSVSTPEVLTSLVEEAVSVGSVVRLFSLKRGQIAFVEVTLAASSPAADKTVGELDVPEDSSLVAIVREGHVLFPNPETALRPGDEVFALASPASEDVLRSMLVAE